MGKPENKRLWHQSGVNQRGEPFVQLLLDGKPIGQMTPAEARGHAHVIIETAEAAETDAFLWDFVRNNLKGTDEAAVALMQAFRTYREERGKAGPPSDPSEWVQP